MKQLSKNRKRKCKQGLHVYGEDKYVKSFYNGLVLVEKSQCIYCGKPFK